MPFHSRGEIHPNGPRTTPEIDDSILRHTVRAVNTENTENTNQYILNETYSQYSIGRLHTGIRHTRRQRAQVLDGRNARRRRGSRATGGRDMPGENSLGLLFHTQLPGQSSGVQRWRLRGELLSWQWSGQLRHQRDILLYRTQKFRMAMQLACAQ